MYRNKLSNLFAEEMSPRFYTLASDGDATDHDFGSISFPEDLCALCVLCGLNRYAAARALHFIRHQSPDLSLIPSTE